MSTLYYRTKCECGNLLIWVEEQDFPQCKKCGKYGEWQHPPIMDNTSGNRIIVSAIPINNGEKKSLREWWYQVLRHYDLFPCCAMLLALPSDKEAIRYLEEYGKELHLITNNICLTITLTKLGFMQYGLDKATIPMIVNEHVVEGHCLRVAKLFDVQINEFPCFILFRDIRSAEHILTTLKGLNSEEIAQEMRLLFSIVGKAVEAGENPITFVENYNKQQEYFDKGKATLNSVRNFAEKTLEKIVETLIEASFQ